MIYDGHTHLHLRFPRLYQLSEYQSQVVGSIGLGVGSTLAERLRPFFVWEQDLLVKLLDILNGVVLSEGVDSWCWRHRTDGIYYARSAYVALSGLELVGGSRSRHVISALNLVWKSWAPSNVQVFLWQLLLDRVPSRHNLFKLRVLIDPSYLGCYRLRVVGSGDHLFLTC